jgi:NADH:ubiquinone oxidoreductase subunit 2 (subunit N)
VAGPLIVNGFLDAQGEPGNLTADAYRPALLTMVGVLAVGFVANLAITRVAAKYREPELDESGRTAAEVRSSPDRTRVVAGPLLVVAWAVVGIPLLYGFYKIVLATVDLFG